MVRSALTTGADEEAGSSMMRLRNDLSDWQEREGSGGRRHPSCTTVHDKRC